MVPTTLGLSTILAASTTSTTTTAVSTIPTAAFSPGTGFANQGMVYAVRSNGNVNIAYPDDSYGSPDTGNRLNPCLIMPRGNVGGYNFSIFVYDSYGTLRSRLIPTLLGGSTLLATSATTSASVSDFPTDFSNTIVTFIQIARKEQ